MDHSVDILIVGGGPAGLTAAIYARRAGRSVLVLEKEGFGGQIASSPRVENYPGLPDISGAELSQRLCDQAEALGAQLELEEVTQIASVAPLHTVATDYGSHTARSLILSTGMKHRTLGLPGEDRLTGISFCAVCDGAFYKNRDVAVCGGGNTALQDALFLSALCRSVTVIHRRDAFRGDPILAERLGCLPNVRLLLSSAVTALEGDDALTGLRLKDAAGREQSLSVSGLFEAVGQLPERSLSESLVSIDEAGFVLAGEDCLTSRPGVFVAGDCRRKEIRQLTTACADGAVAATAAARYLKAQEPSGS